MGAPTSGGLDNDQLIVMRSEVHWRSSAGAVREASNDDADDDDLSVIDWLVDSNWSSAGEIERGGMESKGHPSLYVNWHPLPIIIMMYW